MKAMSASGEKRTSKSDLMHGLNLDGVAVLVSRRLNAQAEQASHSSLIHIEPPSVSGVRPNEQPDMMSL
jgi:hypothetical protein